METTKRIRKAIFPVAGMGTRFLPATKSIPKEMLTIVDRPIIQYAVDEAVAAGCDHLIFVTGRNKRAISDYFDRHPELEFELEQKGKIRELELIRNVLPKHVKCTFVIQPQALGLGHAISCASHLIDDSETFAVLLPDDLIDASPNFCLKQMVEEWRAKRVEGVIAIEQVPENETHKYGVVGFGIRDQNDFTIKEIVEKPSVGEAPSNWCVVGRYLLPGSIMSRLSDLAPGKSGEVQLTDAIKIVVNEQRIVGFPFHGRRFDCGNRAGFLEANVHFGMKD